MNIEDIKKYGKSAQGRKELKDYFLGKQLTARQAILATCYGCMGMYVDGRVDCNIPDCPLYPFMPYRAGEKLVMRNISDEQKKEMGLRLKKATVKNHNQP